MTLAEELVRFAWMRLRRGNRLTLAERAAWMSKGCQNILRRLGFTIAGEGTAPPHGLIVSNHLSHLDILFYSASAGCIFLSKSEVRNWPVFGLLARCGGTIFVERDRGSTAVEANKAIADAFAAGVAVLLFPEGTSSDGETTLPFRSMLFEPAVAAGMPITAAAIGYKAQAATERTLCYYGDLSFAPHLFTCLSLFEVCAQIEWLGEPVPYASRKRAARATYELITSSRAQMRNPAPGRSDDALPIASDGTLLTA